MKTLHLNLKRKWFDMILSGEKKEEYREIKPYFISMFFDWKKSNRNISEFVVGLNNDETWMWVYLYEFSNEMIFSNGMTPPVPRFLIEFDSIDVKTGTSDWGAIEGEKYFVLKLGKII